MSDQDVSVAEVELEKLRDLVRDFFAAEDRVGESFGGYGYEGYMWARKRLREFMTFGDGE